MLSQRLDDEIKRRQEGTKRLNDYAIRIKAIQWAMVKEKAPEIANFMIEINKAFGKPNAVKVELNTGEVLLDYKSGANVKKRP